MRYIINWLKNLFSGKQDSAPEAAGEYRSDDARLGSPRFDSRFENWRGVFGVAVGDKHTKSTPPVPCQDAALARAGITLRPCAIVADGAGSAALSHFGSNDVTVCLSHLSALLEDMNARLLDAEDDFPDEEYRQHGLRYIKHAAQTISHLAKQEEKPFKQFHCTLLMVIVGEKRIFWLHVGDGYIVVEKNNSELLTMEKIVNQEDKREQQFANVTEFIREDANKTDFRCGVLPSDDISGLALMTDGAGERLVQTNTLEVAGLLSKFLSGARKREFRNDDLFRFLSDKSVWRPDNTTGDDKGIALLAKKAKTE